MVDVASDDSMRSILCTGPAVFETEFPPSGSVQHSDFTIPFSTWGVRMIGAISDSYCGI